MSFWEGLWDVNFSLSFKNVVADISLFLCVFFRSVCLCSFSHSVCFYFQFRMQISSGIYSCYLSMFSVSVYRP